MFFKKLIFIFLNLALLSCTSEYDNKTDLLLDGFHNPPVNAKPKGYWCLVNGNFDLSQMKKELMEYKAKGVGTLDIWDVAGWVDENKVVPAGPPFMSDKSLQAIAYAIREAGKIGIDIGLTISSSWNAGGDWVEPQDGVMGLFKVSIPAQGPSSLTTKIPFPIIPKTFKDISMILHKNEDGLPTFYSEVGILAYKFSEDSVISETINLSDKFKNGFLNWEVPEGNWEITR